MLDVRQNHISSYQLLGFPKRVRGGRSKGGARHKEKWGGGRERKRKRDKERAGEREKHINVVIT